MPEAFDVKKLQDEFSTSWKELKGLLDQQADELRKHGETHGKTADGIKSAEDRLVELDKEVKGFSDRFKNMETKMNRPEFGGGEEAKSLGAQFTDSDAYKKMIAGGGVNSEAFATKSFFDTKTALSTAVGSAGLLTDTYRVPEIIRRVNDRPMTIRDLLAVQTTTSNSIDYIEEGGFTNAAAPIAESATVAGTLKPESALSFAVKTSPIRTLAHWIPATRQIIADAPMLRNYIDNRLTYGLKYVEEAQLLLGVGTGENLQGIMTHPNIQDQGKMLGAGNTPIAHIRRAITKAIIAGYPVTGIVMHPTDWEAIELATGTDGHYIWVNVQNGGTPRLWAVQVVQSLAMPVGQFLLGAFGLGAQIWDREQSNIRVSEHHSDYFARNMIAVLCEERIGLTIYRPEAFIKGSFATT